MVIDVLFALLMVLAVIKGYQRGLIVALFSLLAFLIGLAAAMKLSVVVAGYIGKTVNVSEKWLPVLSFILVFLLVVILVRWVANLLQKTVEIALLGWVNRLAGILLYAAIYILIFSVVLFYAQQIRVLKPETVASSVTYPFLQPWGPRAINGIGSVIPFFRDLFHDLEAFFARVSDRLPQ
ncbi:MAG TPA: CvpA family protein [Chitinophagaceae bacterium]|nr:CvpA family protein [Chitinophagaceae bacterium]